MTRNSLHKILSECNALITRALEKSSGVFLWVKVVVKSLIEGLKKCGRISDLRRRVELLPGELSEMYKYMLHTVAPIYGQTLGIHRA